MEERLDVIAAMRRRGRTAALAVAAVVVLIVGIATVALLVFRSADSAPSFPALADSPDKSLHGTVAYLDWKYGPCIHVAAASGSTSKTLGCLDKDSVSAELVWLPDGRLQVTRNGDARYNIKEWQRIYDVVTGDVETVPPAAINRKTTRWTPQTVNNNGERVMARSQGGRATVIVTGTSGSKTVLAEEGGSQYSISTTPSWSPDGAYILLTDSSARLLVVTPDNAVTRILAKELGNSWAITDQEPLTPGS